jgi:hypothetical protein
MYDEAVQKDEGVYKKFTSVNQRVYISSRLRVKRCNTYNIFMHGYIIYIISYSKTGFKVYEICANASSK